MNQPIRVGDTVKIKIDELAYSPDGVGKIDNFIVFVPYSAPGDELEILITEVRKNFARGKILKVLTPSPDRVEAPCKVFGECGGCHWQHIKYSKQLEYKERIVQKSLRKFPGVTVKKAIAGDAAFYYRNKSQFPVDTEKKKIGLYALKSHFVIDVDSCPLILKSLNDVYGYIKKYFVKNDFPIKNLRHVVLKGSETKGQAVVIFVLRDGSLDEVTKLATLLTQEFKDISVLFNINDTDTNIILGRQTIMMFGDGILTEEFKDVTYRVSPLSFFQTNTMQMKKMYDEVRRLVTADPKAEACDLYCGAGTMTVFLADKFRKIIGIDEVKPAIFDARANFELNKKGDCEFLHGRVEDILLNSLSTGYKAKTVILDPPRKGCEKIVLTNLRKIGAEEIIYVSCDVATLARDLETLVAEGYEIDSVQPVDMFPNTFHIENIVKLKLTETGIKNAALKAAEKPAVTEPKAEEEHIPAASMKKAKAPVKPVEPVENEETDDPEDEGDEGEEDAEEGETELEGDEPVFLDDDDKPKEKGEHRRAAPAQRGSTQGKPVKSSGRGGTVTTSKFGNKFGHNRKEAYADDRPPRGSESGRYGEERAPKFVPKKKFDGRKFEKGMPAGGKPGGKPFERLPKGRTEPGREYLKKFDPDGNEIKQRSAYGRKFSGGKSHIKPGGYKGGSREGSGRKPGGYGRRFDRDGSSERPREGFPGKFAGPGRDKPRHTGYGKRFDTPEHNNSTGPGGKFRKTFRKPFGKKKGFGGPKKYFGKR